MSSDNEANQKEYNCCNQKQKSKIGMREEGYDCYNEHKRCQIDKKNF